MCVVLREVKKREWGNYTKDFHFDLSFDKGVGGAKPLAPSS